MAEREIKSAIATLSNLIGKSKEPDEKLANADMKLKDWLLCKDKLLAELKTITSETAGSGQPEHTAVSCDPALKKLETELDKHAKKWENARDNVSRFLREAQYQTFIEWMTEKHRDSTRMKPSGIVDLFDQFLRDERCRVSTELSQNQKDARLLVLGAKLLNQGDVTSDNLANDLSGRLEEYAKGSDYVVFKPWVDIREDRIEPDEKKDKGLLCFYEATANARFGQGKLADVFADTKCLRDRYWVAFDEDVWADALAEFYGFHLLHERVSYSDATAAISEKATKDTNEFFLIIIPIEVDADDRKKGKKKAKDKTTKAKDGHAIFAKNEAGKVTVIDNEYKDSAQIDPKHKSRQIKVYRRSGKDAARNLRQSPDDRLGLLSAATADSLTKAMTTE